MDGNSYITFWDFYKNVISPKLQEVDLFLKTTDPPYDPRQIANILNISGEEISSILEAIGASFVNRSVFLQIMENGSSYICQLYKREKASGSPIVYTRNKISYIYNIDISIINKVCDQLNITSATSFVLPQIFNEISIPLLHYSNETRHNGI